MFAVLNINCYLLDPSCALRLPVFSISHAKLCAYLKET